MGKESPTMGGNGRWGQKSNAGGSESGNILLLVALYFLQGVPLGLVFGTIPFLLKTRMSYSGLAIFSIAGYPYSLKLLWSPLVDSLYSETVGRRKSWIIPTQTLIGLSLIYLSTQTQRLFYQTSPDPILITCWFFFLITCAATQDIAVDGWALSLFPPQKRSYGSTCQTIGLHTGYFLSFTIFLSLNSVEFANRWLRSHPKDEQLVDLGSYLFFCGCLYLATTSFLFFRKEESSSSFELDSLSVQVVFGQMVQVMKLPTVRSLLVLLLTCKIGFAATDAAVGLKLVDRGFRVEDLAFVVFLDFPFQIFLGVAVARWCNGNSPLRLFYVFLWFRIALSLFGINLVSSFPQGGVTTAYFFWVVFYTLMVSVTSTVCFVSSCAFFSFVSDPLIGGTYLTLLNTFSNLGGTWPKFFVLKLIDYFTVVTCHPPSPSGSPIPSSFPLVCGTEDERKLCITNGGRCDMERDGFFPVAIGCSLIGFLLLVTVIRQQCRFLQEIPIKDWRVSLVS